MMTISLIFTDSLLLDNKLLYCNSIDLYVELSIQFIKIFSNFQYNHLIRNKFEVISFKSKKNKRC